jgi:hypothetical protein
MSFFKWSSTGESEVSATDAASGVASAVARDVFGLKLPVVSDLRRDKNLIQVHPWKESVAVVRNAPAQFYCLDMEEADISLVVDWVRKVRSVVPFEDRRAPVIYVIGPARSLSQEERHKVDDELIPSGGYFFKRPEYGVSFATAMMSLRDELERQYGPPETMDAWRRKQDGSEPVVSNP